MRKTTLFLLGLATCLIGRGQITLSPADYLSPLDDTVKVYQLPLFSLQGSYYLPPSEGPNQSWDFKWLEVGPATLDPEPQETVAGLPNANNADASGVISPFDPAGLVSNAQAEAHSAEARVLIGEVVEAAQVVPFVCGSCTNADSVRFEPVTNEYAVPDTLVQFPLAFGDAWQASYVRRYPMTLFLPNFGLAGIAAAQTDSISVSYEVVGWGDLTLPNLTHSGRQTLEVLLLKRTYLIRSFYTADGSPAPAALLDTLGTAQGDTLILTDYSFWTAGLDRPTMSVRFDPRSFFPAYALAGKNADINPAPEGQILARTVMVDTLARTYYVYLPSSYSSGDELPLVFNYHGYTGNGLQQAWFTEMNAVADTGNFMVVYPQGEIVEITTQLPPLFPLSGPGWNVEEILESDNDDLAFFDAMIGAIDAEFGVDSSRIYCTGFSNGGFMTDLLSCRRAGVLAAVAPVSGLGTCQRDTVLPTLVIHGTTDPAVIYEGSTAFGQPDVFSTFETFVADNGCGSALDSTELANVNTEDSTTTTVFTAPGCAPEAEVIFYRVNRGDHWWPGGPDVPPVFVGLAGLRLSRDFNASRTIWEFFLRHRKATATAIAGAQPDFAYQLYPNPSHHRLTLALDLPRQAPVRAILYNTLGQPVATLVNTTLPAGPHQLTLSHHDLPAGLYQCRIEITGRVQSASVLLR